MLSWEMFYKFYLQIEATFFIRQHQSANLSENVNDDGLKQIEMTKLFD